MKEHNKKNNTYKQEKDNIHINNKREEELKSKLSKTLYIIAIFLFIISFIPNLYEFKIYISFIVILFSGYELIIEGIKNIFCLNFEEDTLMTIAIISAFALGEFPESCMVVLLFRLGEFLEDKAVDKSNDSIKDIVEIKANTVNLIKNDGNVEIVKIEDVNVGDKIQIKPGEIVPLDCIVIEGEASLNTANITGESREVFVTNNDKLISGSINLNGNIIAKVEKDYKNSTASQIVDLVYEAKNNKGKTEEFITKFSKIYTPTVIILALIIAFVVPLIIGQNIKEWIMRALVFLVASCPCSIVISVPLAFFSCIGTISKKGMLIKGTKHIESLANAKYIAFDKTGTITTGKMQIDTMEFMADMKQDDILTYLYSLEKNSNHPIAISLVNEIENRGIKNAKTVDKYEEIAGHGIYGKIDEKEVLFGNKKLLEKYQIYNEYIDDNANYLVVDKKIECKITFKEEIRKEVLDIVENLKKVYLKQIIMLTGDNKENAEKIVKKLNINKYYFSMLPQDKLNKVEELKKKGKVIFVGDGINDSPVLASSSFGIAMGEASEIAENTADGILISNNIASIPNIIKMAKKSMKIIKFNIVFSLVIKAIVLLFGIMGIAPVWLAVVADTGVSLLTVLNSVRILKS